MLFKELVPLPNTSLKYELNYLVFSLQTIAMDWLVKKEYENYNKG